VGRVIGEALGLTIVGISSSAMKSLQLLRDGQIVRRLIPRQSDDL
jgi:hypothetical protein